MSNITIQKALPEDAERIRYIQKETWLTTYPRPELGFTREDIEAKVNESQGEEAIERLRVRLTNQTEMRTWVALSGEGIIGFMTVQKQDTENKMKALYVLPEHQGKGIGKALMTTALAWLGNDKPSSLEAVTYNTRAIAFYRSFGFVEEGPTTNAAAQLPSGKVLPETLMIRPATDATSP